jgi:hypothetical protein
MKLAKSDGHDPDFAANGVWEFRLLIAVTTLWFLPIAAFSRLLPKAWRPLASCSHNPESIYAEARHAAGRVVPCVFMG